jgi:signal transduction histidine kinase
MNCAECIPASAAGKQERATIQPARFDRAKPQSTTMARSCFPAANAGIHSAQFMAASPRDRIHGILSEELRALESEGDLRVFQPNQVIFSAGESGDGFYVVESGRVRISVMLANNEPRVLASIGPGDFFGEMAVLDDAPRSATATADVETKALFLRRDKLLQLLERRPQLALNIIREFSVRMRTLNQRYLDEILQAERLAAIGRFAGTIVHDFKNPLTVIGMAAELMADPSMARPLREKMQQRIARQVDRMSNMLQELIEFTRPSGQQPKLRPMNFAQFMQPLADELSQEMTERRVRLVVAPPPSIEVRIEPQRLSRLFYNLLNNAVDEMSGGGTIFLHFTASDRELQVGVEDTGNGIAPEIAASLFRPFATHGKSHGTGLGLTICKRIVEDHGGKIWADSVQGKGATFHFTLPLGP